VRCSDLRGVAGERGSAVVDFALVGGLLTVVFLAVVQLGLLLHVRNTVTDCVAEGARYGARAGRSPSEAAVKVHQLLAAELSDGYSRRVSDVRAVQTQIAGVRVMEVSATAPTPVIGLAGPFGAFSVTAHAVMEGQ
jgi:Flp pilus assembly protein TadG